MKITPMKVAETISQVAAAAAVIVMGYFIF
jgi:hypothetical protein